MENKNTVEFSRTKYKVLVLDLCTKTNFLIDANI